MFHCVPYHNKYHSIRVIKKYECLTAVINSEMEWYAFIITENTRRGARPEGNRSGLDMGPGEGSSVLSSRVMAFVDQSW